MDQYLLQFFRHNGVADKRRPRAAMPLKKQLPMI